MPASMFGVLWSIVVLGYIYFALLGSGISFSCMVAALLSGIAVWGLFEYVMHRFLFHMHLTSRLGRTVLFVLHGNHHMFPRDRYRNLMPAIVSLPLAAAFYFVFISTMGQSFGRPFFLGFLCGYIAYDGWHYATHQHRFSNRILKSIQRHHLKHHYADSESNYGVTTPVFDALFHTVCRKTMER